MTQALFCGGVATFSELYAVQAVLPAVAAQFRLSVAQASLSVSVATGALALSVLPWAAVADRIGRGRAMRISVVTAAVCGVLVPFSPSFTVLLLLRAISGLALGAVPALAMAHLVEQTAARRVAAVAGVYVAGTTIGGLIGRVLAGVVAGGLGWRWGLAVVGVLVAAAAAAMVVLMPRSGRPREPLGRSVPPTGSPPSGRIRAALRDDTAWVFYLQAFLLMGAFVTLYNLLGFRLVRAPYDLPPAVVSLLFLSYLTGTVGSSVVGRLVARTGRRRLLVAAGAGMAAGALVMLATPLALVVAGLLLATFCFFVAHAVASSWAGQQVPHARSQASALYSLAYYAGSSAVGLLGGWIFARSGWAAAVLLIAGCAGTAAALAAWRAPRDPVPRSVSTLR
nr:MFS transporter [Nakamurella flavida]